MAARLPTSPGSAQANLLVFVIAFVVLVAVVAFLIFLVLVVALVALTVLVVLFGTRTSLGGCNARTWFGRLGRLYGRTRTPGEGQGEK